jgi:hypothetical protein
MDCPTGGLDSIVPRRLVRLDFQTTVRVLADPEA